MRQRVPSARVPLEHVLDDAPQVLGVGAAPLLFQRLAELDPAFLARAWHGTRPWIDSTFFEEADVLAGLALEEVADTMPPSPDHVRLGALGGSDLPGCDRSVETLVQTTPRFLLVALAWHRAVTEPGFGSAERSNCRPLVPGVSRFMCDLPRPPAGAERLAEKAASAIGLDEAAAELLILTPWPDYLRVATEDLARHAGTGTHAGVVERVVRRANEIAEALASPMPVLSGLESDGADLVARAADVGPALLVDVAFLRLGMPQVARIPRVA